MIIVQPSSNSPKPIGAYSVAVKSGGVVYVSGQIGIDPSTGGLVDGGLRKQTEQVLKNLSNVLMDSGSDFSHVLMTTIFLTSMNSFKEVGEIYAQYVNPNMLPARQTVAVKDLPLGALVEISLIAKER